MIFDIIDICLHCHCHWRVKGHSNRVSYTLFHIASKITHSFILSTTQHKDTQIQKLNMLKTFKTRIMTIYTSN